MLSGSSSPAIPYVNAKEGRKIDIDTEIFQAVRSYYSHYLTHEL